MDHPLHVSGSALANPEGTDPALQASPTWNAEALFAALDELLDPLTVPRGNARVLSIPPHQLDELSASKEDIEQVESPVEAAADAAEERFASESIQLRAGDLGEGQAAAEERFSRERAKLREDAIREGRAAAAAEFERRQAKEYEQWRGEFQAQLAVVQADAERAQAAAVCDARDTAIAATEARFATEMARVWDDALREGQAAAAAAERRRADALTRLSTRVLRLVTDQLVTVLADDEHRRERAAAALQALATLDADLTQAAVERMHQVESVQALVNEVLAEEIRQGPANGGGDGEPAAS